MRPRQSPATRVVNLTGRRDSGTGVGRIAKNHGHDATGRKPARPAENSLLIRKAGLRAVPVRSIVLEFQAEGRELVANLVQGSHAEVLAFEKLVTGVLQDVAHGLDIEFTHALASAH